MNKIRKKFNLDEAKIQASLLLKSFNSSENSVVESACVRFLQLPEFTGASIQDVKNQRLKRKQALNVIALEHGFSSWTNLKIQIGLIVGGHLNNWFTKYDEARSYLNVHGGYLFPYKNQYFVCSAAYVKDLGFDPTDHKWALINFDAEKPLDKAAWIALLKTRKQL